MIAGGLRHYEDAVHDLSSQPARLWQLRRKLLHMCEPMSEIGLAWPASAAKRLIGRGWLGLGA